MQSANICNEAAIFAGRREGGDHRARRLRGRHGSGSSPASSSAAVVPDKEKRILAFHEAGHDLLAHLMGDLLPIQKVTIVARGDALGYADYLPTEDRYLHTREELLDVMKIALGGRAAEQLVFGRVYERRRLRSREGDRDRTGDGVRLRDVLLALARTTRADNYALSEETKRMRDSEQARLTDEAYEEAQRLLSKHRRTLDWLASALLEKEEGLATATSSASCCTSFSPSRAHRGHGHREGASGGATRIDRVQARGIHHLGVAGDDLDEALSTYLELFGGRLEHRATVPDQGVEAAAVLVGAGRVELVSPLGDDTPVGRFLAKRGPGIHHVADEVADVEVALEAARGVRRAAHST